MEQRHRFYLPCVCAGYQRLREFAADGQCKPQILFTKTEKLEFPRDITANQYGIRFFVVADNTNIKFEIVSEARTTLNAPALLDWLPVPSLDFSDQCTEKLLANADRWLDTSIESRDLIDFAVLRLQNSIPENAIIKAEKAYPVMSALTQALTKLQNNSAYRQKCFTALQIENKKHIINGIDLLAQDINLKPTERKVNEL